MNLSFTHKLKIPNYTKCDLFIDRVLRLLKIRGREQNVRWLDLRDKYYGYKKGWMEPCERMLLASFKCLCSFVEDEDAFNVIDMTAHIIDDSGKTLQKEVAELYDWWIYKRPNNEKKNEELLDKFSSTEEGWNEWYEFEQKMVQEDQEMLIRLIKIREYLWT